MNNDLKNSKSLIFFKKNLKESKMPQIKNLCIFFLFILPFLGLCDFDAEPSLDLNEPSFDDEDDRLLDLLQKHDIDHQGFYSKESYKDLLTDILTLAPGNNQLISEVEKVLIKKIVSDYVDKQEKSRFTYREVVEAMENEEVLEALTSGLHKAGEILTESEKEQVKKEESFKDDKKEKTIDEYAVLDETGNDKERIKNNKQEEL